MLPSLRRVSHAAQMYMLGAHLISTYSGRPYTQFVKERIWDPLNMTSTTFSAKQAAHSGRLTHTWTSLGRRIPFWFPDEWIELNAGPGGIISSVVDLVSSSLRPSTATCPW